MQTDDQVLSALPSELPGNDASPTVNAQIPGPPDDPLDPHAFLSPSSALSQGLAEHVVSGQSKKVPWPNILCRLREAFSLNMSPSPGEKDIAAMQAVSFTHPTAATSQLIPKAHNSLKAASSV